MGFRDRKKNVMTERERKIKPPRGDLTTRPRSPFREVKVVMVERDIIRDTFTMTIYRVPHHGRVAEVLFMQPGTAMLFPATVDFYLAEAAPNRHYHSPP